jgi:hypothetical protein
LDALVALMRIGCDRFALAQLLTLASRSALHPNRGHHLSAYTEPLVHTTQRNLAVPTLMAWLAQDVQRLGLAGALWLAALSQTTNELCCALINMLSDADERVQLARQPRTSTGEACTRPLYTSSARRPGQALVAGRV